jgi:hypothetical protein
VLALHHWHARHAVALALGELRMLSMKDEIKRGVGVKAWRALLGSSPFFGAQPDARVGDYLFLQEGRQRSVHGLAMLGASVFGRSWTLPSRAPATSPRVEN